MIDYTPIPIPGKETTTEVDRRTFPANFDYNIHDLIWSSYLDILDWSWGYATFRIEK